MMKIKTFKKVFLAVKMCMECATYLKKYIFIQILWNKVCVRVM